MRGFFIEKMYNENIMEISYAIAEAIKKRTASTALGTYLFFWITYHWQGVYTTIFTSQDIIYSKFGLLKNEYVNKYFFGLDNSTFLGLVIPLLLTILFIWPIPKYILIRAYELEQKHKTQRRKIKFNEDKIIQELDIEKVTQETAAVSAATKLSKTKKNAENVDPAIIWHKEYEEARYSKHWKELTLLIESVYGHSGKIKDDFDNYREKWRFEIPNSLLVYADTNNIITLNSSKDKIDFTDKGKFFVKQLSKETE